ncbi:extradiol ring-cleavage dioxygenase [Nocardia vaccinii]|uniref:DODA-type extradiol aromatic ring-opening family dioxygenase n=1 Tax=Nocardia vaccinii TaxID=1822 RepID=UPI000831AC97|nr:extradiol ring-cleavage dioxygenase [Nocardia vaccinii]
MGDILGLGLTHYPMLAGKDQHMSSLLRMTLKDPDIPQSEKDPQNWPAAMRAEWSDDKGRAAAGTHRRQLRDGLAHCRKALDAFKPDVLVVWGDDQYENFREEIVPPFCVLAYPDLEIQPLAELAQFGSANVWELPTDTTVTLRGAPQIGKELAAGLLEGGFDMSYSYRPREGIHFPHAIANTQLYLDYDNAGSAFDYPVVPIAVNCYGSHVVARRGGVVSFARIAAGEQLDPPAPSPRRCFELGRAVAATLRQSSHRVALIASSSWSHAFLNDKDWHLHPDTASDRAYYEALVAGDIDRWLQATTDDLVAAGQQEMLNWFCLLGAMTELNQPLTWSSFVETGIFNSNKCFAVYEVAA